MLKVTEELPSVVSSPYYKEWIGMSQAVGNPSLAHEWPACKNKFRVEEIPDNASDNDG